MPSILLAVKHAQLDLHNLRLRERITRETSTTPITTHKTRRFEFPEGADLRGIPAIGAGSGGTQPGTRPGDIAARVQPTNLLGGKHIPGTRP